VDTAFSGEGARRYPGRWNERGVPVVYTAASLSLAAMEMLVHLGETGALDRYVSIPIHFDSKLCQRLSPSDLPSDWSTAPAPVSTRTLGTRWAQSRASAVLAVPSCLVPIETVFLLNPLHPDFGKIKVGVTCEFRFDERLFKRS
jgi:RES domain-containing protein